MITTDGMENASHRYSSAEIKRKIKRQQEKYGWEFIFLAANIDAVETADGLGIHRDRAANYRRTSKGINRSYLAINEAITDIMYDEYVPISKYLEVEEDGENGK